MENKPTWFEHSCCRCSAIICYSSLYSLQCAVTDPEATYKEVKELIARGNNKVRFLPFGERIKASTLIIPQKRSHLFKMMMLVSYYIVWTETDDADRKEDAEQYILSVNNEPRREILLSPCPLLFSCRIITAKGSRERVVTSLVAYNLSNEQLADARNLKKAYAYFCPKQFDRAKPAIWWDAPALPIISYPRQLLLWFHCLQDRLSTAKRWNHLNWWKPIIGVVLIASPRS